MDGRTEELAHIKRRLRIDTKFYVRCHRLKRSFLKTILLLFVFFFGIDIEKIVELSSTQKLRPTYVGDIPTVKRPSLRDSVLFVV